MKDGAPDTRVEPKPRWRLRRRTAWSLGVVVLALVLALPAVFARLAPKPPTFETAAVVRRDVASTVTATGTLQPMDEVEIGSQVSGSLSEVRVDFNSRVKAGQVLAVIDPASFQARVVQQRAAVARAEAAERKAAREFVRAKELFSRQLSSTADLDAAEANADQATADLQQARAVLESAQLDLAHTVIRSPIDGVVISRSVETGQTVAASLQAPTLFVIARDLAHMKLETSVDEADVGSVRPGLDATFTVDAFPARHFGGTVAQVRLQPTSTAGVVSYTTILHTENPDLVLLPGMTADVTIELGHRTGVLCVPDAALRFRPTLPEGTRKGGETQAGGTGSQGTGVSVRDAAAVAAAPTSSVAASGPSAPRSPSVPAAAVSAAPASTPRVGVAASDAVTDTVFVLGEGPPRAVVVRLGLSDGSFTEVLAGDLKAGDRLVTGASATTGAVPTDASPGLAGLFRPPMPRGGKAR